MEAQIKLGRIFGVQGSHRNLTGAALGRQTEVAETFGREADENGRERRSEEKLVQRLLTSVFVVSLLFAVHGCSVAKRASRSSETDALLQAARAGNADTVRALVVSPNVDVNGIDEHGNTSLIEAARFGHDEVVTALLMAKADMKVKNDEGKTALMLAAEGGHDETVRVLTQAGAGK